MPTYITLVDYTEAGIANMNESPTRLEQARDVANEHGGEVSQFFLTMGEHDAVTVSTFPDDESYAKAIIRIAQGGSVRTKTLKAFTESEYRDICDAL